MTTTTSQLQQICCQIALITLTFCYLEFSSALACLLLVVVVSVSVVAATTHERARRRDTSMHADAATTTTTHRTFRCKFFLLLSRLCAWVTFPGVQVSRLTHTRDSVTYIGPHSHTHRHTLCIFFLCKHKNNNSKQKFLCCRCEFFSFIFYVNDNARVLSSTLCIFILITRQLEINSSCFFSSQSLYTHIAKLLTLHTDIPRFALFCITKNLNYTINLDLKKTQCLH